MPTGEIVIKNRGDFAEFLEWTAGQVDELVIGKPQAKDLFISHIDKVMAEAEKYKLYLRAEYRKAKKAGRTRYDDEPKGKGWHWYSAGSILAGNLKTYYFDGDNAYFWGPENLELDPLDYFGSMVHGACGKQHPALDLIDYQLFFLVVIRDMQRIRAGQERIYFDLQDPKTLADRVGDDLRYWLAEWPDLDISTLRDVQITVRTALKRADGQVGGQLKQKLRRKWELPDLEKRVWEYICPKLKERDKLVPGIMNGDMDLLRKLWRILGPSVIASEIGDGCQRGNVGKTDCYKEYIGRLGRKPPQFPKGYNLPEEATAEIQEILTDLRKDDQDSQ